MSGSKHPCAPSHWKVKPRGALRLAATLMEQRDDAFLYRSSRPWSTVPIEGSLEDLKFGVPRMRFMSWCDELGVARLKTAPRRWQ